MTKNNVKLARFGHQVNVKIALLSRAIGSFLKAYKAGKCVQQHSSTNRNKSINLGRGRTNLDNTRNFLRNSGKKRRK